MPQGLYEEKGGTSMATPFLSGAVGLAWAVNPNLSLEQVKDAVILSAHYLPAIGRECIAQGVVDLEQLILQIK
jgi:subtilisin family serine protease